MSKNENKTIVLTSSANPLTINVLKSNFNNSEIKFIPEDYSPFNREELAIEINNTYKQVIFYGYHNQFYLLLPLISKKVVKKYIINISVPQLATQYLFTSLLQVLEYQDRGLIDFIATTRYDLYVTFKQMLDLYKINPNQINLEITETAQLSSSKQILSLINSFVDAGVKFSLDDFGTGSSNLEYITSNNDVMIISSGKDGELKIIPNHQCNRKNIIHVKLLKKQT